MRKLLRIVAFLFISSFLITCVEDGTFEADDRLPVLELLVPDSAKIGDIILVKGANLSNVDSVFVNGVFTQLFDLGDSTFRITIPAIPYSGPISARNVFGWAIGPEFTLIATTVSTIIRLDSVSPNSGKAGDQVTIYGDNFQLLVSGFSLFFNEIAAGKSVISDTEIIAMVPDSASSGLITINNLDSLISGPFFTIEQPATLLITSINPTSGPELTEVTITGQNFGNILSDIEVLLNGEAVDVNSVADSEIKFTVPDGATTGPVTVKNVVTGQGATGPTFTVLPPAPVTTVSTFASSTQAQNIGSPFQIVEDGNGGYYYSDPAGHRIKSVNAAGVVSNYAGTGQAGFTNGNVNQASFSSPSGLAIDAAGDLYVADLGNHAVRKITTSGIVSTVAGFGQPGFVDGLALQQAQFNQPIDVAIDGNSLFISDFRNHAIRLLNLQTGIVSTYTGNGTLGFVNGNLSSARFRGPAGISLDANNNILVADLLNHSIRLINRASNQVSTIAGNGSSGFANGNNASAQFNLPYDVGTDAEGAIYVADRSNHSIRKIADGTTSTLAGTGVAGLTEGDGEVAQFNNPLGLMVVSPTEILVCDFTNGRIRKVTIE